MFYSILIESGVSMKVNVCLITFVISSGLKYGDALFLFLLNFAL